MNNRERLKKMKELRPYIDPNGNMFMIINESDYSWLIEHVQGLEHALKKVKEQAIKDYERFSDFNNFDFDVIAYSLAEKYEDIADKALQMKGVAMNNQDFLEEIQTKCRMT